MVKRLCKVALETPLTLQTIFNNPFLWQQGYINTSIWEPPWRPVYCLFLFWCNKKSSFNDRCCWQCSSKRTTNHSKSMFVQVQINKKDEWLRGNEEGVKLKMGEPIQKWQREKEEHWELEGNKTRMGTESAWGQEGENKKVTKKVRSKHKFKSC